MHPMIKSALRRGWRDRQTVRYGVTPGHSVLFGPLDGATESFLTLLDGTRGLPALRDAAAALGLGRGAVDRVLRHLHTAGVLDDATADREVAAQVTDALRPDLASLSLLHPAPGEGLRRLVARRQGWVRVHGAGRVGAAVAATLAQAGVGRVEVVDGGQVAPEDSAPAGLRTAQVGERREVAARTVVRDRAPWRRAGDASKESVRQSVGLVVFAPRDGIAAYAPDPAIAEPVRAAGTPHLYAGVVEATGFVGPLVVPGATGCGECLLRHRAQREPTWPLLVTQWRNARKPGVPACDTPLATVVAGLTAASALAFLDGSTPSLEGRRMEVALPTLTVAHQTIAPHPECPCGAAHQPPPADPPGAGADTRGRPGSRRVRDEQPNSFRSRSPE